MRYVYGRRQRTETVYRGYSEGDGAELGPVAVFAQRGNQAPYRINGDGWPAAAHAWGAAGSGAAQLARDILTDYLGYPPPAAIYQDFRRAFVAHWPGSGSWAITARAAIATP